MLYVKEAMLSSTRIGIMIYPNWCCRNSIALAKCSSSSYPTRLQRGLRKGLRCTTIMEARRRKPSLSCSLQDLLPCGSYFPAPQRYVKSWPKPRPKPPTTVQTGLWFTFFSGSALDLAMLYYIRLDYNILYHIPLYSITPY